MKMIYKIASVFLLAMFFVVPAQAQDWGEVRAAKLDLNVREKRTPKSGHVMTLTTGERVKCDFLKNGWFAIFDMDETVRDEKRAIGYANSKYLQPVAVNIAPAAVEPVEPAVKMVPEGRGAVKSTVANVAPEPVNMGADSSKLPVQIASDRMTYDETGKVVSFVGNVVAEHGELTLRADRLSAFFASSTGKKFAVDSVDRIVAEGNVRATRDKTEGECGKVTYYVTKQMLTMEKNPVLRDGPNSLTGDIINFYVRENRSEVVGSQGKRVKAIFMAPSKMKGQ